METFNHSGGLPRTGKLSRSNVVTSTACNGRCDEPRCASHWVLKISGRSIPSWTTVILDRSAGGYRLLRYSLVATVTPVAATIPAFTWSHTPYTVPIAAAES